jgi:hypothetical protein
MKKMHWVLSGILSLFILASCGKHVYVQKDNTVDFSKIRTYAWVPAQRDSIAKNRRSNSLVDSKIKQSINANLKANGWAEARRNPDVYLVYDVDVQRENVNVSDPVYSQPMTRWYFSPYSRRYTPIYYPTELMGYNNRTETVNNGTLTLTVTDARTNKTIWQGWTTSEVNGRRLSDKEIDDNVKAIVKKLDNTNKDAKS